MGYKLAGFEVLGGVEIDPQMMRVYRANHHPKHSYLMGVQEFKTFPDADLPSELFDLDILDGSPPCSTFSMAGAREKKWGRKHHFREGQAAQHLDELFFEFIDVSAKLKPKVVIAENVRGLIIGNAKGYVKQIFAGFKTAGYTTKLFLLNAAAMGVPQRRERTVFVSVRNDIDRHVSFDFSENQIPFGKFAKAIENPKVIPCYAKRAKYIKAGDKDLSAADFRMRGKNSFFNHTLLNDCDVSPTLTTQPHCIHYVKNAGRPLLSCEKTLIQSFPEDFYYCGIDDTYIKGMSVPPFMMQRIALEVGRQIFDIDYDRQIVGSFDNEKLAIAA